MYLVKTPWWLKLAYGSSLTWNIPTQGKEIFLTFDDGPHPEITTFVLDQLKGFGAKATFFCLGKNVDLYPSIYRRILDEGHAVGNHTYDHVNGWKTSDKAYFDNVAKANKVIDSKLFRPPYGRISKFQQQHLSTVFKIVMWEVLSGDFDNTITKEKCLANVISNTRPGSIVLFHDSEKAFSKLEFALPGALQFYKDNQFSMQPIQ